MHPKQVKKATKTINKLSNLYPETINKRLNSYYNYSFDHGKSTTLKDVFLDIPHYKKQGDFLFDARTVFIQRLYVAESYDEFDRYNRALDFIHTEYGTNRLREHTLARNILFALWYEIPNGIFLIFKNNQQGMPSWCSVYHKLETETYDNINELTSDLYDIGRNYLDGPNRNPIVSEFAHCFIRAFNPAEKTYESCNSRDVWHKTYIRDLFDGITIYTPRWYEEQNQNISKEYAEYLSDHSYQRNEEIMTEEAFFEYQEEMSRKREEYVKKHKGKEKTMEEILHSFERIQKNEKDATRWYHMKHSSPAPPIQTILSLYSEYKKKLKEERLRQFAQWRTKNKGHGKGKGVLYAYKNYAGIQPEEEA